MIKIYKWFFTLQTNANFYINKEMYEEAKKESFDHAVIYVRGQINSPSSSVPVHHLFKVLNIKNDVATSQRKKKYQLMDKLENYTYFEEAVKNKMTIIYDWFIGVNRSQELQIEGIAYEEGFTFPINERIVKQDIEKSTITLGNGETVFVVWGSINDKFEKHIQKMLNTNSKLFIEEPIDLFKNINKLPDLLSLEEDHNETKRSKGSYQKTYKKN